jgi:hypothetical protein
MSETDGTLKRRSVDWLSVVMATVTVAALLGAAWFKSGSFTARRSLSVGDRVPVLQFVDLDSSEPILMAGLKGKVVWIVFWSANEPAASSRLSAIARVSSRIRTHRRFSLVTAAVEAGEPERVRAVVAQSGVDLPVYLASPESLRRFAAENGDPPLNVLIDAEGQVIAIARGAGDATLERLADQAKRQLDELDPMGNTRFAHRGALPGDRNDLFELVNPQRHELIEQGMGTERCAQMKLDVRVPAAELVARGGQIALEVDSG